MKEMVIPSSWLFIDPSYILLPCVVFNICTALLGSLEGAVALLLLSMISKHLLNSLSTNQRRSSFDRLSLYFIRPLARDERDLWEEYIAVDDGNSHTVAIWSVADKQNTYRIDLIYWLASRLQGGIVKTPHITNQHTRHTNFEEQT